MERKIISDGGVITVEAEVAMMSEWSAPKVVRLDISRTLATLGSGGDASGSAMP